MTWVIDRWLQLEELAGLFGLSEETINRVAKSPGVLTSEMLRWLKASAARTADLCKAGKLLVNLFTEPSLLFTEPSLARRNRV